MTDDVTQPGLADLEAKVAHVLVDQLSLGIDAGQLAADASLVDDVGLDSVALIRFAMGLENAFDIEIDDEHLIVENFETVGRVAAYIQTRIAS